MGVLPAGSGNGFAMNIGIGRRINAAIDILNKGRVKQIDTCLVNGKKFVNIAGVGLSALVSHRIKTSKFRGFFSYLWFMGNRFLSYKAKPYTIEIDNRKISDKYLIIEVANGPMYGYNFVVAAFAKLDDGHLEVVLIKRASKLIYLLSMWRFLTKTVHKSRLVENYKAKKVVIQSDHEKILSFRWRWL